MTKPGKTDLILKKLTEHDQQFAQIKLKLTDHDEQFVQIKHKLTEHDEQLVKIDQQFEQVHQQFNEVKNTLDKIVAELEKAREDRVFAIAKDRQQDQQLEDMDQRLKTLELNRT